MEYLIKAIKEIVIAAVQAHETGFVFGEVTSLSPLKIKVEDVYEIGEEFISLSGFCKETWIKIPKDDEFEHKHEIDAFTEPASLPNMLGAPPEPETVVDPNTGLEVPNMPKDAISVTIPPAVKIPVIGDSTHTHAIKIETKMALPKILLWRGLEIGDKVKILRLAKGQIHYVTERIEGVTNDPS